MGKVTWRAVRHHPVRLLMTVLAVALGIAFMSGTLSLRTMMSQTYTSIAQTAYEGDAYVRGTALDETTTPQVRLSSVADIEALPGVDRALPTLQGQVVLVGADGQAVRVRTGASQRPGDLADATPSRAIVVWPDDPGYSLTDGALPQDEREIALTETTAEDARLTIGDQTTIVVDGAIYDVTVSGLVTSVAPSGETTVVLDEETGTRLLAASGTTELVSVFAADGTGTAQLVSEIEAVLPSDVEVLTGDQMRDEKPAMDASVELVPTLVTVFAVIALVVGAFIISNTFAMLVRQRMRETALLRALGASGGQVFRSVVGQAAIIGVVGSAVGAVAGFGVVGLLQKIIGTMGLELSGSIPFDVATIVICLVLGTLVAVVSAAVPAWRAAKIPPIAAMRESTEVSEDSSRVRGSVGGALVTLGTAGIVGATVVDPASGVLLGVGAAALFVGALVVAPAVVTPVVRVLAWPARRWLRPLGALASGNVTRRPRRTASTASALMIAMVVVGAVSVLAAGAQESFRTMYRDDIRADFVLQSAQGPVPAGAVDAVREAPHAERTDSLRYAELDVDGFPLSVGAAPGGMLTESLDVEVVAGTLDGLADDEVVVLRSTAEEKGWTLGDEVTIDDATVAEPTQVTGVVGAIVDSSSLGTHVIVSDALYDEAVPATDAIISTVLVHAKDGDVERLRTELAAATDPYLVVTVLDHSEYVDAMVGTVAKVVTILSALLALSLVIAVLGVVNTLALSVMERTREIGVMRAVGLGRLQLAVTVVVESILISVFGSAIGLGIGVGIGAALPSLLSEMGLGVRVLPWGQIAVIFALTVVVAVLAALAPAVRASRMPVLQAITEE